MHFTTLKLKKKKTTYFYRLPPADSNWAMSWPMMCFLIKRSLRKNSRDFDHQGLNSNERLSISPILSSYPYVCRVVRVVFSIVFESRVNLRRKKNYAELAHNHTKKFDLEQCDYEKWLELSLYGESLLALYHAVMMSVEPLRWKCLNKKSISREHIN